MASNLTQIGVMNMALDYLRQQNITAVTDDTAEAKWLGRNYAVVRDGLLRAHPWNFAIKRASIAADATNPSFGWDYAYTPPSDWLKILPLTYLGQRNGQPIPYEMEGNKILTNWEAPLLVRYVARVTDEGAWDVLFADALAVTLAYRMAHWMTGKQSLMQALGAQLQQTLAVARLNDALEGTPEAIYDDEIISARYT